MLKYLGKPKNRDTMLGQYLITFREVLEAALIISIIMAYLIKIDKKYLSKYVWLGLSSAVIFSIVSAAIIAFIYDGLSNESMKLFEGIAALIAVVVLTSMILWMAIKGRYIQDEVRAKIKSTVEKGTIFGLAGFSFIVVFREGFETVLFLTPFGASDAIGTAFGVILGVISALGISFLIFIFGIKMNLGRFFYFSSLILVLLAGGLLGYGIHELIEYQEAIGIESGWMGTYAFNMGISEGHILHHKGAVGAVFAVMFGYSVKMEWARLIAHLGYLFIFIPMTYIIYKKPELLWNLRKFKLSYIQNKLFKHKTKLLNQNK
jgi:high-affinity iron transporter